MSCIFWLFNHSSFRVPFVSSLQRPAKIANKKTQLHLLKITEYWVPHFNPPYLASSDLTHRLLLTLIEFGDFDLLLISCFYVLNNVSISTLWPLAYNVTPSPRKVINRFLVVVGRVFTNGQRDWGSIIPKTQKWYVIPSCLIITIIRHISRVKWSNLEKEEVFLAMLPCSSYWKGSLQVTLDYGYQLYI